MTQVRLGLRENAAQFSLLVALNALVGAMVGLERSVLPLVGEEEFGLTSTTAILAFVLAFGIATVVAHEIGGQRQRYDDEESRDEHSVHEAAHQKRK